MSCTVGALLGLVWVVVMSVPFGLFLGLLDSPESNLPISSWKDLAATTEGAEQVGALGPSI